MKAEVASEPWLQAGDHLTRDEFIAIWEQLPHIKRAELIGGIVYMPSPQRKEHSRMDRHLSGWLAWYQAMTPGCDGGDNATSFIGEDCPQPDKFLAILRECGGRSWGTDYVRGSPEFIGEISFTSVSTDLHEKFDLYQEAGIQEYMIVLLKKQEIRWHRLVKGVYKRMSADSEGVFRSRVFPGLWLDSGALFKEDMAKVLATLQKGIASEEHQRFVQKLADRKRKGTS